MGSMAESRADAADTNVPIVDLRPFTFDASAEEKRQAAEKLVTACREVGFVYIKNHGVPADELARAFEISKKFYDLPTSEKMKAPHPPGWAVHRGYSWPGLEKVSGSLREEDDEEFVKRLREVHDFKVGNISSDCTLRLLCSLRSAFLTVF
jgi:isopenicillin N synthase-like dioxygenase